MNRYKSLGLVGLAAASLFATQAFAAPAPLCSVTAPATGAATYGSPVCIAEQGQDFAGSGLQNQLDLMTTSGTPINVYNDQAGPNASWSLTSGGNSNTILLEIAGNSNTNSFGIYDLSNQNNMYQLFNGPAGAGSTISLTYNGGGIYSIGNGTDSTAFGSGSSFGYYLGAQSGTFYLSSPVWLSRFPVNNSGRSACQVRMA